MISQFHPKIRSFLRLAEVDRPTFFGILSAIKSVLMGPVTPLLITAYFTPEIQGFYYTFASVLGLQIFVELGLGQVIVQFASHEWAHLSLDGRRKIVGSPEALSRLASVGAMAFRWYAAGGILVVAVLGLGGYLFFLHSHQPTVFWTLPWFALCVVTGIRLLFIPVWSILEGCNQLSNLYLSRLVEGILSTLSVWLAITSGAKLWTASITSMVVILWNVWFLGSRYKEFIRLFLHPPTGPHIHWLHEIWPMQSRIAISWISGYFCFGLFTPVLFHYHGPVVAGRLGMTSSFISVITSISGLWISTKVPQFGALIAKKKYEALDRLFYRCTVFSTAICSMGALGIWSGTCLLYFFGNHLANRILPPLPTGLFLLAAVLLQGISPMSFYLRAHKKEPHLVLNVTSGLLIALSTWFFGSRFGATGMAVGYLAVLAFMVLPWLTVLWNRCRTEWHSSPSEGSPSGEFLMAEGS